MSPLRLGSVLLTTLAIGASNPAGPPEPHFAPEGAPVVRSEPFQVAQDRFQANWTLPSRPAQAVIVLQHGYLRRCANLRQSAHALGAAGWMVLCLDAPMTQGNPVLAEALAKTLLQGAKAPGGQPLPERIIVAGHSAGGRFAASLGAHIDRLAPHRLAGALLFDPVATPGFEADLRSVSRDGLRPVVAVLAQARGCNAELSALPVLLRLQHGSLSAGRSGFVGVQLGNGSSHLDVEGGDTDWFAAWACGSPSAPNVELLRELAVKWAGALARGDSLVYEARPGTRKLQPEDAPATIGRAGLVEGTQQPMPLRANNYAVSGRKPANSFIRAATSTGLTR